MTNLFIQMYFLGKHSAKQNAETQEKMNFEQMHDIKIDALDMKIPVTKEDFLKIEDRLKNYAFMVANYTQKEIIREIQERLSAVIKSGGSFEDFMAEMDRLNYKVHEMVYYQNLWNIEQAGRYQQMKETVEDIPYWQYLTVEDGRVRPEHAKMHGKIFRHDDPIWDKWYPPNGFGCRCQVYPVSESFMEKNNLRPENGSKLKINPDEGFANNPGKNLYDWLD